MASPMGLSIKVYNSAGEHLMTCDNLTQARARVNELYGYDSDTYQVSIVYGNGEESPVYQLRVDKED